MKFTSKGFLKLSVRRITPASNESEVVIETSVSDSGAGMDSSFMQVLFQPYCQANASVCRMHGGTGLGLAICKHIVELMGGDIVVKSTLGEGSTFTFTAKFTKPNTESVNEHTEKTRAANLPIRIMLVEDNMINQKVARRLLERDKNVVVDVFARFSCSAGHGGCVAQVGLSPDGRVHAGNQSEICIHIYYIYTRISIRTRFISLMLFCILVCT